MMGDPANANRELRSLVTAIRGPLEDELADRNALPARRERMKTLHRNVVRLLQLVNTLFDDAGARARPEGELAAATTAVIPMLRDAEATAPREPLQRRDRTDEAAWAIELERANEELEAFSFSVSHDLRGPLRAIDGFSQVLLSDYAHGLDRGGRDLLEQIHGSARRMSSIIDDLLALSQVSKADLQRESVDLTAIARRVVSNLRLREPARIVEVSLTEGLAASGDERLVTIALENLFANAWKFTSKRPQAQIIFDREDGDVFALRDNGAGFDMARSEHLFEPFQRLHTSAEFDGTGVGLTIVRRVVERHGGHVWAQGVVDRGATIRFTLAPDPR